MRLVLVGPPGSGKGTQAKLLVERDGLTYVGTGDILREAVRQGTEVGKRAAPYLAQGQLVPDDLVNDLIAELFHRADRPGRFVMDGYPRTQAQAVRFDQMLRKEKLPLDAVVHLRIGDDDVVRRLGGRWTCTNPACNASYNLSERPPKKAGVCDKCGHPLFQRPDDRDETIRQRLSVFHQNTDALLEHYRKQGLLREVSALDSVEAIHANIVTSVHRQR